MCSLALIRKPGSFDPARAQLRTWQIAVVRRRHLGRRRRSAHEPNGDDREELHVAAGLEGELIRVERAGAVRKAMNALPPAQPEALYLFEFKGLSLSDVAGILNIEVNAVKARLYRCREQLKLLLSPLQTATKGTPLSDKTILGEEILLGYSTIVIQWNVQPRPATVTAWVFASSCVEISRRARSSRAYSSGRLSPKGGMECSISSSPSRMLASTSCP